MAKAPTSYAGNLARAVGQGVTFGFGDEIEAGIRSLGSDRSYDEEVADIRKSISEFRDTNPVAAYGSEIAGSIPTGIGLAGVALRGGIKGALKIGALEGSIYGAGEGEGVTDTASSAAIGAGLGGALGKAGEKALEGIAPLVGKFMKKTRGSGTEVKGSGNIEMEASPSDLGPLPSEELSDLTTPELLTSWTIEPGKVNRAEVAARVKGDPEATARSNQALDDLGYGDSVPMYRVIKLTDDGEIVPEELISATLDPSKVPTNINFLMQGKFSATTPTDYRVVRYDVPRDRVAGYLPALSGDITQKVNKAVKQKGFGQEKIEGLSTVTNPAKHAKSLLNMQDEIIADVSGLEPRVLADGGKPLNMLSLERMLPNAIASGEIKTIEDFATAPGFGNYSVLSPRDFRSNPEAFEAAERAARQKAIDEYSEFFGIKQPVSPSSSDGTTFFREESLAEKISEAKNPKSRETITYMSPDEFLTLAEKGESPEKLAGVRELVDNDTKFSSLPSLRFTHDGKGMAKVEGHEGRHRMMVLKDAGVERVPVRFESSELGEGRGIRWGSQDPDSFDFVPPQERPTRITNQDGDAVLPMFDSDIYPVLNEAPTTVAPKKEVLEGEIVGTKSKNYMKLEKEMGEARTPELRSVRELNMEIQGVDDAFNTGNASINIDKSFDFVSGGDPVRSTSDEFVDSVKDSYEFAREEGFSRGEALISAVRERVDDYNKIYPDALDLNSVLDDVSRNVNDDFGFDQALGRFREGQTNRKALEAELSTKQNKARFAELEAQQQQFRQSLGITDDTPPEEAQRIIMDFANKQQAGISGVGIPDPTPPKPNLRLVKKAKGGPVDMRSGIGDLFKVYS